MKACFEGYFSAAVVAVLLQFGPVVAAEAPSAGTAPSGPAKETRGQAPDQDAGGAGAAPAAAGPEATAPTGETVMAEEPRKPEPVEPLMVRPLMRFESGRNDSNPAWSPSGTLLAFERSRGDKKEIVIARPDGTVVHTVYYQLSEGSTEMNFFFPGVFEEVSYNAGITWAPTEDRFVFMSNGGEGNYDIYLRELGGKTTTRLTDHKEKDGHAHWSPVADSLLFVSGRTGKGDLYLMKLSDRSLTRLTRGGKAYLYPQWSGDGKKIVMMHGSNENHDIFVIDDPARPAETLRTITRWNADDLRPAWSPDGTKIAFYTNYNEAGDPRVWAIIVVAADGSDPKEGAGLAARIVAEDVVPDVERGPAWMPDSSRIIYVKNDRQEYNPIFVVDINDRTNRLLKTDTKMNHDVSCAVDGSIAFRAQVNQWDQIYIAKLKPTQKQ